MKVGVPDGALRKYLLPLAQLYDARPAQPLLDTLITQKCIHKQLISCMGLMVKADTTFAWVQNLVKNIVPTGEPGVDSLLSNYDLEFKSTLLWGWRGYTWLEFSHRPLNTKALARRFLGAPGVANASPNSIYFFVTKLEVLPSPERSTVRFYYGYGDCMSGCFGYERWTYSVTKDNEVIYEGYVIGD